MEKREDRRSLDHDRRLEDGDGASQARPFSLRPRGKHPLSLDPCAHPGCTGHGTFDKGFCAEHVEENCGARDVAARVLRLRVEDAQALAGTVSVDAIRCRDVLGILRTLGARTEKRLAIDVELVGERDERLLRGYIDALERAGLARRRALGSRRGCLRRVVEAVDVGREDAVPRGVKIAFDAEKIRALHAEGKNDREIGDAMGIPKKSLARYRASLGLPPQNPQYSSKHRKERDAGNRPPKPGLTEIAKPKPRRAELKHARCAKKPCGKCVVTDCYADHSARSARRRCASHGRPHVEAARRSVVDLPRETMEAMAADPRLAKVALVHLACLARDPLPFVAAARALEEAAKAGASRA